MEKFIPMSAELHRYVVRYGARQDDLLRRLQEETAKIGDLAAMQIAPEEGALLGLLAAAIGARHAVEVGTFTGYSAISIARGLAPGGKLLCCDVSAEWTAVARRYLEEAGLGDRVEIRLAPALETLRQLPASPPLDFVFIDADKTNYSAYWEEVVPRVRPGGLVIVDNVLWNGTVIDESRQDESVVAIRALNERIAADERVDVALVPFADGVTIARKR